MPEKYTINRMDKYVNIRLSGVERPASLAPFVIPKPNHPSVVFSGEEV